ncbi:DUF1707 domain-containing protein [Blastococcus sp. TF02A-26]|uniref:DUF1707 SHOCT-like domain-containing protein n=1 Tax=Blastococcus sp. TF02A-26 TaxID=2250577 RepID=UPI000DEA77A1|nr:DUF1707 domain-containing protein [Blastococcus sp. TF02A-26]RBY85410.1 hypothetical protein DQ240_11695 [Blastococcus sp. TF02A-26]
MTDDADRTPAVRASDADREAVVARLQTALTEGRIDVDEFGERVAAAYAAVTTADLAGPVADLPGPAPAAAPAAAPAPVVGGRAPERVTSFFGDVVVQGGTALPQAIATVFGDIRLDLRGLRTSADRVELGLGAVFGDVEVVVDEGVEAELQGWTVFGDKRTELAPVPRAPGTPLVVVRARTLFGDLRLRSLAPGEPTSRWRARLERWHRGHLPPPPR